MRSLDPADLLSRPYVRADLLGRDIDRVRRARARSPAAWPRSSLRAQVYLADFFTQTAADTAVLEPFALGDLRNPLQQAPQRTAADAAASRPAAAQQPPHPLRAAHGPGSGAAVLAALVVLFAAAVGLDALEGLARAARA
jgi:hypothetical protein